MKTTMSVLVAAMVLLATSLVYANPIQNGNYHSYGAGWFPVNRNAPACALVCRQAKGAQAEREGNSGPPPRRSFLCRTVVATARGRRWLYGTQFDQRPACYVTGLDLKGRYVQSFSCLCVQPAKRSR